MVPEFPCCYICLACSFCVYNMEHIRCVMTGSSSGQVLGRLGRRLIELQTRQRFRWYHRHKMSSGLALSAIIHSLKSFTNLEIDTLSS